MLTLRHALFAGLTVLLGNSLRAEPAPEHIREVQTTSDSAHATIRVFIDQRAAYRIPREITGKFAEHLGWNIYNGMDAQIVRNPTFADYPFWDGQMTPDGVTKFQTDKRKINEELRRQGTRFGWPAAALDGLVQDYGDALAAFWSRQGSREQVQLSPDTSPFGGRAQRIEVKEAEQGVAQWTWLPLHRQRRYELELMGRSPDVLALTVSLWDEEGKQICSTHLKALNTNWSRLHANLSVPPEALPDQRYKLAITADSPGQFVLKHAFLRPVDHIDGADPDIVRLLKDSHLPLLRWPGGNFVSTYHWRDGVGPIAQRPTRPNFAWGALEPNTFGTDEFMAFCRAVGCEPMICINAGSGSPWEAAEWVEYCNGPVTSAMGRLRAAYGHPEPYQVKRWEVGNELWGHWQMEWTTAKGYVDRFKTFAAVTRQADPSITLYACGAPAMWGENWNNTLIGGVGSSLPAITDHPLIGGNVPPSTDPLDVCRDFMAVPEALQRKWAELRGSMVAGGIGDPRLAVTELQLFAHLAGSDKTNAQVRLTHETMPGQGSITEALYDVLIYHAAVRMLPFVELITHSAVVNHGGGLRKERERVWANPCHYAQSAFAEFGDTTPVRVQIVCANESAPMVLPDLRHVTNSMSFGAIDALAAVENNGTLLMSIVHRGSAGPIHLSVESDGFKGSSTADVHTLTATTPWQGNSLEQPELVKPIDSTVAVQDGRLTLDLAPYSVVRIRLSKG
jgi:alpha-N-arabinofuranosidase